MPWRDLKLSDSANRMCIMGFVPELEIAGKKDTINHITVSTGGFISKYSVKVASVRDRILYDDESHQSI